MDASRARTRPESPILKGCRDGNHLAVSCASEPRGRVSSCDHDAWDCSRVSLSERISTFVAYRLNPDDPVRPGCLSYVIVDVLHILHELSQLTYQLSHLLFC